MDGQGDAERGFVLGVTLGAVAGFVLGALVTAQGRRAGALLWGGVGRLFGRREGVAFEVLAQ